ncbi:TetR/AcrR family transcriptional regulator [Filobacillus milosensis]|uniref:TetR/AcrR family transcriptional regulator n=1 Tax=Filobacillus milosensis TaxID=94137 RepID=A0A4Y8IBX4_9BACI|nr:TetR-like C-terminal domain-containing protein [Filobacillus milosensis]TFB13469.1 TetR/AcrR family transcriptional regulator [Filobacillus milosensis]
MSKKLDRRKKYTRKVLKESLVTLLSQKTISKITVKELCEMADVNRSTFYTHYSDQYDLLEKIEEEIAEDMNQYLSSYSFNVEEESLQMTEKLLEYIKDRQFMFQTLLNENGDPTFEVRLRTIAQRFMINNWLEGQQLKEVDMTYLSTFVVSGAVHVIKEWIEYDVDVKQSPKEMAELINKFANEGLSCLE